MIGGNFIEYKTAPFYIISNDYHAFDSWNWLGVWIGCRWEDVFNFPWTLWGWIRNRVSNFWWSKGVLIFLWSGSVLLYAAKTWQRDKRDRCGQSLLWRGFALSRLDVTGVWQRDTLAASVGSRLSVTITGTITDFEVDVTRDSVTALLSILCGGSRFSCRPGFSRRH